MNKPGITRNMAALFVAMIFGNASERIMLPLFALVFFDIQSQLLATDTPHVLRSYWYGICMAIPSIATFIAAPLLSSLSDHFGRKNILTLSLSGTMVAGIIASIGILLSSIILFLFGIFIQGLFCRTNPLAQAAVGDVTEDKNKLITMGYLQSMIAFGAFLGPILGGYCAHFYFSMLNFSTPFFISALFSAVAAIICIFFFKETSNMTKKIFSWRLMFGSIKILKNKHALFLMAILAGGQITWSFYYQYVPAVLKISSAFSAGKIGLFVGFMALWVTLGSTVGIRFLRQHFSLRICLKIALISQVIGAILIVIALYFHQEWLMWGSSVPAAVGDVIAFGVLSTACSNLYSQQQGQIMGACYLVAAIMWILTGLGGGYLIAIYNLLPLLVSLIGAIIALIIMRKPNLLYLLG